MNKQELFNKLKTFPRKELAQLPTPMKKLENLSSSLGGPEVYIKRDDLTGLAFGGNKSRKLEWIIADAIEKKSDTIVTWASIQSNWCLQTAAAARIYGIFPVLILFQTGEHAVESDGNLLLDKILDAKIFIRQGEKGKVVTSEQVEETLAEVVYEVRQWGRAPYIAPIGGSLPGGDMQLPLGAFGYLQAYLEMMEQAEQMGINIDYVVHATGSGGTQAGLIVGARAAEQQAKILGISVSEKKENFTPDVLSICRDTTQALGLDIEILPQDVMVFDEYIGRGYGYIDRNEIHGMRKLAVEEGIFLDPVYTGTAFGAFLDLIDKGFFKPSDWVVFLHTGGTPALFPYRDDVLRYL